MQKLFRNLIFHKHGCSSETAHSVNCRERMSPHYSVKSFFEWGKQALEFLQPLLFLHIFLVTVKCLFSVMCIAEVKENSTPQGYHNNGYKLRQVILPLTFSDVNWIASAQLAKTARKQDYTMYSTCQQLELLQTFS